MQALVIAALHLILGSGATAFAATTPATPLIPLVRAVTTRTAASPTPRPATLSPARPVVRPSESASTNAPVCLGRSSPADMRIERDLSAPPSNSFLHQLRNPAATRNCTERSVVPTAMRSPSSLDTVARAARAAADQRDPQLFVNSSCITSSLSHRDFNQPRRYCATDSQASATPISTKPCLTSRYVNFVAATINRAIRCLSTPGQRLNPDTVFGMINNESGFNSLMAAPGGMGLTQMTTIAARSMLTPRRGTERRPIPAEGGYTHLISLMQQNPQECRPFIPLLEQLRMNGGSAQQCQFIATDNGIGRSAILGIGLFLYYRDGNFSRSARRMLQSSGVRPGPEFEQAADLVALHSYFRGQTEARALLDRSRGSGRLIAALRSNSAYLTSIEAKRREARVTSSCSTRTP